MSRFFGNVCTGCKYNGLLNAARGNKAYRIARLNLHSLVMKLMH